MVAMAHPYIDREKIDPYKINKQKIDRENISSTYELIRPQIRRTPVIEIEGGDFGLNGVGLILKLELLTYYTCHGSTTFL